MYDNTHFSNAIKYWYMGKLYDWHETQLHPMTFALHYGGSVFEGIRVYRTPTGPAIFRLSEHIDRLIHSASIAHMEVTYNRKEIIHAIKTTLKENHLESAYIRPLLFYSFLRKSGAHPEALPRRIVDRYVGMGRLSWRQGRTGNLRLSSPLEKNPSQPAGYDRQTRRGLHPIDHLRSGSAVFGF